MVVAGPRTRPAHSFNATCSCGTRLCARSRLSVCTFILQNDIKLRILRRVLSLNPLPRSTHFEKGSENEKENDKEKNKPQCGGCAEDAHRALARFRKGSGADPWSG